MAERLDVVTIGEVMLGLRAPQLSTLESASCLECLVAGSEVNVAVGLVRLGLSAAWISKLPRNPLAQNLAASIRGQGVLMDHVVWVDEGRLGTMYLELGVPPRPNRVVYDRKGSAASTLSPAEVDWTVFDEARHLHLTGITPALSDSCRATVERALEVARNAQLTVSFDVNYRSALWAPDEAAAALGRLLPGVDILCVGRYEAEHLFGLTGTSEDAVKTLRDRYQSRVVVLKQGQEGALLYDGTALLRSHVYPVAEVNRQGVGDAFLAGLLFGFLKGDPAMGLEYGSAVAALKLTLPHVNYPLVSREAVEDLIRRRDEGAPIPPASPGGTSYQVQR